MRLYEVYPIVSGLTFTHHYSAHWQLGISLNSASYFRAFEVHVGHKIYTLRLLGGHGWKRHR